MKYFELKKNYAINFSGNQKQIMKRNLIITENLIGKQIEIYNGLKYVSLDIIESMVGQRLGEFAPTRKKPIFKKKK